jgi:uncharacterized protein YjbJ (UPF0337 family)
MGQTPEQIASKLKQIKGQSGKQWGRVSDIELQKIREKRAALVSKIQKRYSNIEANNSPAE